MLGGAAVVGDRPRVDRGRALGRAARAELCTGSERKLVGVWDAERRAQIRTAFAATKLPFAEDSLSRAEAVLDGYSAQWVATHREACEATSVPGEQAPQVLTLRMTCLQQRLDAVAALTELFARADPGVVGKAKQSLDALPNLAACSDIAGLTAKLPPPEDPKVAAEVERIRKQNHPRQRARQRRPLLRGLRLGDQAPRRGREAGLPAGSGRGGARRDHGPERRRKLRRGGAGRATRPSGTPSPPAMTRC